MNPRRRVVAALALCAGIASAQPDKAPPLDMTAFRAGFASLKDPDSLQVRNPVYKAKGASTWIMCGEYNAKNSYGGYTGFKRFMAVAGLDRTGKKMAYAVAATETVAMQLCADEGM